MELCTCSWSFGACSLEEAAAVSRALGFQAMDVDGAAGAQLRRDGILSVSRSEVDRVRALDLVVPNIHWTFGVFDLKPAINDPDPAVRAGLLDVYRRLVEFCHEAGIRSVLILPGVIHPDQSPADARALAAESLNAMLPIAREAGVELISEPHIGSAFETPESALGLVEQTPGLKVVLDYGHFVCLGHPQAAADPLCVHAAHVHIRQGKRGQLQSRFDEGEIDFALVLDRLRQAGYAGYLAVEYEHANVMGLDQVDVITETVKMRDFLRSQLAR